MKDDGEVARMAGPPPSPTPPWARCSPCSASGSEEEVALALDTAMRRLGAEDRAFETIVASGPNPPNPTPARRSGIVAGDPVVIDFGAIFDGYRSDMTRTFCAAGPPRAVGHGCSRWSAEAQAAGVAAVVPAW